MSNEDLFEEAVILVQNLDKKPTNNELLKLYGLYKQVKIGDNNTKKPDMFDLKGTMKWDYWMKEKGKDRELAMQDYIEYVVDLIKKYNK
tara:strand:+ start:324 stop:590 length:267 start_codon:yes stop_codon:yes gene_type:complete